MTVEGQEQDQHRLQAAINAVRDDLEQVTTYDLPAITENVEDVERQVRVLEARVEQTEDDVREHDSRADDLSRAMKQIKTSVQWIERHIRSSGAVTAVDLDTTGADLYEAAQLAEAGAAAQAQLLAEWARTSRTGLITRHTEAVARSRTATTQVLGATAELTQLDWDDPTHDLARARYRAAKKEWIQAGAQVTQSAPTAKQARQELAADDARRAATAAIIAKGQRGRSTLLTRLRTRIADAVLDGALMPIWLHDHLGAMPHTGETAQWVDIATQILAYRITYRDQDPLVAIGKLPANASSRRRQWATEIERAVSNLHA
jgi:uncharacterized protein YoxC